MRFLKYTTLLIAISLSACIAPPAFYTTVTKYAVDNGSNVTFSVNVANNPTTVTCFNGNVIMSKTATNTYTGTANYSLDLVNSPGTNNITCTASTSRATTTAAVGFIELIPNVAPNLVMLSTQTVCGNDGTKNFNTPLVNFVSTTYVTGAVYTLTAGTLPSGLSIDTTNGNLVGTTAAGNYTVNPLKMTATTVAGANESSNFQIQINQAACP